MSPDDFSQRLFQRRYAQTPLQTHGGSAVIGGAPRLQLIQETIAAAEQRRVREVQRHPFGEWLEEIETCCRFCFRRRFENRALFEA